MELKSLRKKCVYFSESCLSDQCQPTAIILFALVLGNNQSLALQAKKKLKVDSFFQKYYITHSRSHKQSLIKCVCRTSSREFVHGELLYGHGFSRGRKPQFLRWNPNEHRVSKPLFVFKMRGTINLYWFLETISIKKKYAYIYAAIVLNASG